ncbi:MAG: RNA polymerase sigma-70 factor [Bacteroidota bacterium]
MKLTKTYHPLDETTLRELFDLYYNNLCRFASGYLSDPDTAEEIVQQVFINLWNQREKIDPEKQIKSYLFTSVKNRCLNHIRDNRKYRSYYLDVETELEIQVDEKDIFAEAELEKRLSQALEKLPEKCREVFVLCRFEEMKYKEVADKLNISQKTVEAQMSKALKILREEFKDLWSLIIFLNLMQ